MAHVSTHWGWCSWWHRAGHRGNRGQRGKISCTRPPSALCLRRWSLCSRGSSSITPSAWGRRCSVTPPSPAPPVPQATSSASSNSSASPEPGRAGEESPVAMKPGSGMLCCPTAPLRPRSPNRCAWGAQRCGSGRRQALAGGGQMAATPTQITIFIPRVGFAVCLFGEPGQSQLHPCALHRLDSLFANLRNKGCVSVPLAPVGGAGSGLRGARVAREAEPRQSLMLWAKLAQPQLWGTARVTPLPLCSPRSHPAPGPQPLGRGCRQW